MIRAASRTIRERKPASQWAFITWVLGVLWPPIPLTLFTFQPRSWIPGLEGDWRLFALIIAAVALALAIWRIARARAAGRGPQTRLGVVWRFVLAGAICALAAQGLILLASMVMGWMGVAGVPQGLGVAETSFLVTGVGLLPLTTVIAAAWATWAGLVSAWLQYETAPEPLRTPPHMLRGAADQAPTHDTGGR